MAEEPIIIRPSSLSKWPDCGLRSAGKLWPELFRNLGFQLRETPTHVGAIVGTAVHRGTDALLRQRMQGGEAASVAHAQEAAVASLDEQIDIQTITWDPETPNISTAARQTQRMLARYRVDVANEITPIAVEQNFKVKFNKRVMINGTLDTLAILPGALRDTKTGKFPGWNVPQYGAYSAMARAHGHTVDRIVEDYIPRVRIDKEQPPVQQYEVERRFAESVTQSVVSLAIEQREKFERSTNPFDFNPNPSSMLCRDIFCPMHSTSACPVWSKR